MQTTTGAERVADFGSRRSARIAWIVFLTCLVVLVAVQQGAVTWLLESGAPVSAPVATNSKRVVGEDGTVARKAELAPPGFDIDSLNIKFALRFSAAPEQVFEALEGFRQAAKNDVQRARLGLAEAIVRTAASADQVARDAAMKALDDGAEGPTDPSTGQKNEAKGVNDEELLRDMSVARRVYELGSAKDAGVTEYEARLLKERHGYLGELTLAFNDPAQAEKREKFLSGGAWIIALSVLFIVGGIGLLLLGVGLMVVALVFKPGFGALARGSLPERQVGPGGSLPIELAAVFAVAFLAMALLLSVARAMAPDSGAVDLAGVVAPWGVTALLLAYPLIRGVPYREFRRTVGLIPGHAGRGVLREVGVGVLGWVAMLPLVLCAAIVSMILGGVIQLFLGSPPEQDLRIPHIIATADVFTLLAFFALLTLWAPLTEELVFRGGVFRQMSTRMVPFVSVLLSSLCFAVLHPLPIHLMLPVFTLGCLFAVLRHWRGSLIASITAHSLNNALVGMLILFVFRFFLGE